MHSYVPRSIRQLKRLLRDIKVGMVTTETVGGTSHSRPMLVQDVDDSGWLWLLTDRYARQACELGRSPHATVSFQSNKGDRYISLQGTAIVVLDDVKLRQHRNPWLRAWFPRVRRDRQVVLVAVRVTRAEYWLVPRSRLGRVLIAAKAMLGGRTGDKRGHGFLDLTPLSA